MSNKIKTSIERKLVFQIGGRTFLEQTEEPYEGGPENFNPKAVKWPHNAAVSVQLVEVVHKTVTVEGEEFEKKEKREGTRFWRGRWLTKEQASTKYGELSTLASNMRSNGWDRVVDTKYGTFPPGEGDEVLEDNS